MNKTIVVFGSSTGTCEAIAEKIAQKLGCEAINVQCGDCESYGDTFVGGIGELYNGIKESGARFVGAVSTDGYTFDGSEAVVEGKFVGLPLDDVNEDDKTDARIDAWVAEISPNL